jgi:mannose-6-phosphate isomerase-like protein (cupin superfamily)
VEAQLEAQVIRYSDIAPMIFPTSRETRVYAGARGLPAQRFTMGYVVVEPDGSVPLHHHDQEEVYFLLDGVGEIDIDGKRFRMEPLSAVYIPAQKPHKFRNVGQSPMRFLFVYAPAEEVSHWAEESARGRSST